MMHGPVFLFLALLIFSCGKSGEKSDSGTGPAQREESGHRIRYNAVTVEKNCGFWTDCDFIVRSDFNQRPLILYAHFLNNSPPDEVGECDFQIRLSETDAAELEARADKLRFCHRRNRPTADRGFDGLFVTTKEEREVLVYKYPDGGQEEQGDINYLCGGRNNYYSYLKALIEPRAPAECPDGYLRLFQ